MAPNDLVLIDADKGAYPVMSSTPCGCAAWRSPALDNMLWHDKVADPAARDEATTVLRDLGKTLRDDERLISAPCRSVTDCFVAVRR